MKCQRLWARASCAIAISFVVSSPLFAQTTSGTSATIVVPVIAQTASFGSEVTVYNPTAGILSVNVAFYDANNLGSPGLKACTGLTLAAGVSAQFSIAGQCALPAGSNFGLLLLSEATGTQRFYGYARTQTPQGVGFSTEGFPIENFNDQLQHTTGLKRVVAAGGLPAYQTNCFVTTLGDAVSYELRLFDGATNAQLGGTLSGSLAAFEQFRYLDVFAAAGVAAGDKSNVRAQFSNLTGANKKLIGFCTVQENTNFSADFRIAKSYGGTPQNAFVQGGNTFGTTALLGTIDNQQLSLLANNAPVMTYLPNGTSPNLVGGHPNNGVNSINPGQTVAGGGQAGSNCHDPSTGTNTRSCGNQATGSYATIGGGFANQADLEATVGGGATNSAAFSYATVSGGQENTASGGWATVGGGLDSVASNSAATVGGGNGNVAAGFTATVGGGQSNTASGSYATVPGGISNQALGKYSFAAGAEAIAGGDGSFAWSDATGFDFDPTNGPNGWGNNRPNTFSVRATGGVLFVTAINGTGQPSAGVEVFSGNGAWSTYSDRNGKDSIAPVSPLAVLEQLVAVPIATWRWKAEDEQYRHMGPMAQDFYAAFHLGADDRHIVTIDAEGVALAAIQGLNAKVEGQIAAKIAEIGALKQELAELRHTVEVLMARGSPEERVARAR